MTLPEEMRERISEIFINWGLPTRQIAISDIMALIEEVDLKAREDMTFKIMSSKTEGLFDNGELFIKRRPIEQAIIDELGYEKFKAIQEAVDAMPLSPSKESK